MDFQQQWDFADPAGSEARFRAAVGHAADPVDAVMLRTQVARALGLQGRFDDAAAELDAVEAELSGEGLSASSAAAAEARVHLLLERGRLFRSSGHEERSVPLFAEALDAAQDAGLDPLAGDAVHMMAVVGSPEAQLGWAARGLALVAASPDPNARRWAGPIENNRGWTLHGLDRHDEALACFERALVAYTEFGDPERIRVARWSVARGLRAVGRLDEALAIQRDLEANGPADGYVHDELAELLTSLGQPDEAAAQARRAKELLG